MKFFSNVLSIDESRISILIISFISVVTTSLYYYATRGDVTNNMVEVIKYQIMAVAGVNMANSAGTIITNFVKKDNTNTVLTDLQKPNKDQNTSI